MVTPTTNNGDGSYTVVYELRVQNVGDVALSNVQVVDDLSFFTTAGATIVSAVPTSSPSAVHGERQLHRRLGNTNLLATRPDAGQGRRGLHHPDGEGEAGHEAGAV